MKKILSIAGSDSSGGAGIQADIKTIAAHDMYAMTAITALTAQNTMGVTGIENASPEFVGLQIDAVFQDIPPDAVKIGMVSEPSIIEKIAEKLTEYKALHVVADPVMVATSGSKLLQDDAIEILKTKLLPLAEVITPNMAEAEVLSGLKISSKEDMLQAAEIITQELKVSAVLVKGGHLEDCADDLLWDGTTAVWFQGERIDNPNTHGTGCTLSSAIACELADGHSVAEAVRRAKSYLTGAIRSGLNLGHGSGPLDHMYCRRQ